MIRPLSSSTSQCLDCCRVLTVCLPGHQTPHDSALGRDTYRISDGNMLVDARLRSDKHTIPHGDRSADSALCGNDTVFSDSDIVTDLDLELDT